MNWRRLRTLMLREARATFRSPFTVAVLISVPLAALLIFGFVLSTEVKDLALGVLDADHSSASRRLLSELVAQNTFVASRYDTREDLEHALVAGDISVALVIPPDFSRRSVNTDTGSPPQLQVLYDGGEAPLAGNAEGFLQALLTANVGELFPLPASASAAPRIDVVTRALFNPKLDGKPYMISGTFGFVLSFLTVLLTAVSIVNERITGTFEQLQVTPATGLEILLGKILPLGAIFTLDVVLMVLVAGFLLEVWPAGSAFFFVAVSSFYVLVSLALGVIISATSATAAEAVQKSVMFSVPLVQLSGFLFPIRNMPTLVQWIAEIFPATHYIRVSHAIYMRGDGPIALAPELGLLLLFGVMLMFFALSKIEARG